MNGARVENMPPGMRKHPLIQRLIKWDEYYLNDQSLRDLRGQYVPHGVRGLLPPGSPDSVIPRRSLGSRSSWKIGNHPFLGRVDFQQYGLERRGLGNGTEKRAFAMDDSTALIIMGNDHLDQVPFAMRRMTQETEWLDFWESFNLGRTPMLGTVFVDRVPYRIYGPNGEVVSQELVDNVPGMLRGRFRVHTKDPADGRNPGGIRYVRMWVDGIEDDVYDSPFLTRSSYEQTQTILDTATRRNLLVGDAQWGITEAGHLWLDDPRYVKQGTPATRAEKIWQTSFERTLYQVAQGALLNKKRGKW